MIITTAATKTLIIMKQKEARVMGEPFRFENVDIEICIVYVMFITMYTLYCMKSKLLFSFDDVSLFVSLLDFKCKNSKSNCLISNVD